MVATLPIESSKALFPIQQIEISRILAAVGVIWAILMVVRGARPVPRVLAVPIGLIVAIVLVSWFLTRYEAGLLLAVSVVAYAGAMVFTAQAIEDERGVALVMVAVFATGVAEAALALGQEIFSFYVWREGVLNVLGRSNATFGDPNILARFLGLAALAGLCLVAIRPWHRRRWDAVVLLGLGLIGGSLVVTQSRWGWLSIAIVVAASLLTFLRQPRAFLATGVIALGFAASVLLNPHAEGRLSDIANGISGSMDASAPTVGVGTLSGSAPGKYLPPRLVPGHAMIVRLPIDGVRIYLIEAGIAMWQDHPLAGVGTGGYQPEILGPYYDFIPLDRRRAPVSLPHTSVIQVAAENGWIGLLALLGVIAGITLAAREVARSGGRLRIAGWTTTAGLTLIAAASQAEGRLLQEPYLWLLLGLLAALVRIARRQAGDRTPQAGV